jgi:hypothetical protein
MMEPCCSTRGVGSRVRYLLASSLCPELFFVLVSHTLAGNLLESPALVCVEQDLAGAQALLDFHNLQLESRTHLDPT